MNKLKKLLIAVCCVLLFTATALFAVACDDDTPGGETPEPKQYTVTLDFDAEQGDVTLAPKADNNKYDEGTEVTVTVTAKEHYAVDKVTVGGQEVSLVSSAYTFKVTADTTVKATFKEESTVTPAEEYTVTLDYNKDQGDVKLTPAANSNGKYAKGTTVTVEVTAKENYAVDKVTVGGNEVNLVENKHSFEVTGDVTVQVTFKGTTVTPAAEYTVSLEYNHEQGEVTLSPKANDNGKYEENTVVTVNIVPNEHYLVKSVTVGGEPLEKQNEAYTFTVTSDVTVSVEFQKESAKFSEQLQGTWQIQGSSDEGAIIVGEYGASFGGKEITPNVSANGFTFTVTDDEGDSVAYTATLKNVLTDKGTQKALVLSFVQSGEKSTIYYLNSAVDYTYTFAADFVGNWAGTSVDNPISVEATGAYMTVEAGNVATAIVLSYTSSSLTYNVVFASTEYTLKLVKGETKDSDTLQVKNLSDTESQLATYHREKEVAAALLAAAYAGTYKHDDDVVIIYADGTVAYNGSVVKVSYLNDGSSLAFSVLTFRLQGDTYWLTPGEPFDDVVKVQNLSYGSDYSYTRQHTAATYKVNYSAEVDGATYSLKANGEDVTAVAPKTEVTLSLTLKTGYLFEKVTVGGVDVTDNLVADGKTYTYTFPVLADLTVVAEYKEADTYTVTVNVTGSENGSVTLNSADVEGSVYTYTERDTVVVTVKPNAGKAITSFKVDGKEVSKSIKNDAYTFEITANTEISVTFADKAETSCDPHIWGAFTVSTSGSQSGCIYLVIDATGIKVYKNSRLGFGRDANGNPWSFSLWGESYRVTPTSETVNEDGSYSFTLSGATVTYRVCYSEETGITYLESTSSTGTKTYYPMVRYIGEGTHEFTAPANFIGEWQSVDSASSSYKIVIEAHAFKSFTTLSAVLGEYEVLDENHILVNGCTTRDFYCRHSVYLLTLYKNGDYNEVKVELVGTTKMDDLTLDKVYCLNGECAKFHVNVDMPEGQGEYSFNKEGDMFRGTVTLTIKPYGGYVIDTVTVDGEPVTASTSIKLVVHKETDVKVTFKEVTAYSITVENEAEKGSVTFSPECLNGKLNENTNVRITATAVDGWFVSKITVTGIGDEPQVSTSNPAQSMSLTVSKLTADITVKVEYTKAYTIEVDKSTVTSAQGTVTSNPGSAVIAGGTFTLTITVKPGYMLDTFTVNGEDKKNDLVYNDVNYTYTLEGVDKNLQIAVSLKEAPTATKDGTISIPNGESVVYDTTDDKVTAKTKAYVVTFTLAEGQTAVAGGLYVDVVDGTTVAQKTFEMYDPSNTGVYRGVVVFDKSGQKLAFTNKSGEAISGTLTFEAYTPVEVTETDKEYVVPVLYYNYYNPSGNYAQYAKVNFAAELASKQYYMVVTYPGKMTGAVKPCGSSYSSPLTDDGTNFTTTGLKKQVTIKSQGFFASSSQCGFIIIKLETIPTYTITVEADGAALKRASASTPNPSSPGSSKSVNLNAVLEGTSNITITIESNTGWFILTVKGVYADGTVAIAEVTDINQAKASYKITGEITQDMTITVTFVKTYSVTNKAGTGGSGSFNKSMPALAGTEVTYTVTPKGGYLLDTFTINGVDSMDKLQQGDDGKYTYTFELTEELDGAEFEVTFKIDEEKLLKGDTGEISLEKNGQVMLDVREKEKGLYLLTITLADGNETRSSGLTVTFYSSLKPTGMYGEMYSALETGKYLFVVYIDGTNGFLTLTASLQAIQGTYSLTPYTPTAVDDGEEHNVWVLYMSGSSEAILDNEENKGMIPSYTISDPATYTVKITFPSSASSSTTYYLAGYKDGKVQLSTVTSFKKSSPTKTIDLSGCDEVRLFTTGTGLCNVTIQFTKKVVTTSAASPVALPADFKSLSQED